MEISQSGGRVAVTLTLTVAEFARALADGELRVALGPEGAALDAATVGAVCAAYGPESLGANLLWEIAQAGEAGITASALKELLGLETSKQLAGAFSGLGKVLAREAPGTALVAREWSARDGEYTYRMAAATRALVLEALG